MSICVVYKLESCYCKKFLQFNQYLVEFPSTHLLARMPKNLQHNEAHQRKNGESVTAASRTQTQRRFAAVCSPRWHSSLAEKKDLFLAQVLIHTPIHSTCPSLFSMLSLVVMMINFNSYPYPKGLFHNNPVENLLSDTTSDIHGKLWKPKLHQTLFSALLFMFIFDRTFLLAEELDCEMIVAEGIATLLLTAYNYHNKVANPI